MKKIQVLATHEALLPTDEIPSMPIEYVYRLDYENNISAVRNEVTKLEHQIAVLERVIARQDAMLVAKDGFGDR